MTTSSLEIAILVGCDQCGRRVCDIAELPGGQLHPVPLDGAEIVEDRVLCGECREDAV